MPGFTYIYKKTSTRTFTAILIIMAQTGDNSHVHQKKNE